jgi:hypothetical protein
MRNLIVALAFATAVMFGGAAAWKAEAAGAAGAMPAGAPTQVTKPIHPAACGGYGPNCPPGYRWVCGPYGQRCWCAPC